MKRIIAGVILSLVTITLTQSAVITTATPFLGLLQLITRSGKNPASAGEMNTYLLMTRGQKWHSAQSTQTMSCKRMSSPCDKMKKTYRGTNGYDN